MLSTLITKTKTTLTGCTKLVSSAIYERPLAKDEMFAGFPAVVFYPDTFTNEFMTVNEDLRGYNFAMYVITEANVKTISQAMVILADAVDEIMQKFGTNWNAGTINNHRVWQKITQGRWEFSASETGITITAPLNLFINVAVDN
jgi:hypothetical protein